MYLGQLVLKFFGWSKFSCPEENLISYLYQGRDLNHTAKLIRIIVDPIKTDQRASVYLSRFLCKAFADRPCHLIYQLIKKSGFDVGLLYDYFVRIMNQRPWLSSIMEMAVFWKANPREFWQRLRKAGFAFEESWLGFLPFRKSDLEREFISSFYQKVFSSERLVFRVISHSDPLLEQLIPNFESMVREMIVKYQEEIKISDFFIYFGLEGEGEPCWLIKKLLDYNYADLYFQLEFDKYEHLIKLEDPDASIYEQNELYKL